MLLVKPKRGFKRLLLRTVFHVVNCYLIYFVIYWGTVMKAYMTEEQRKNPYYRDFLKYSKCALTNWNLLFQTVFLTLSVVYDIMEWLDRHDSSLGKKIKFCVDVCFSGLVVPMTLFICSMFWIIFWINRELVFPEVYDQLVPWWFNHCVHTNIVIVVLIETILQARRHPRHFKLELALTGVTDIAYAVVYYSIYFFANRWLYGVFGIMTWWQVCLFQILIWTSTIVFYFIQFPINRLFHKEESSEQTIMISESKTGKAGVQNEGYKEDMDSRLPERLLKHRSKGQVENSSF